MGAAPEDIHPTHNPESAEGPRLYRGGIACRRCGWFVAFDGIGYRVTGRGAKPCAPGKIALRE